MNRIPSHKTPIGKKKKKKKDELQKERREREMKIRNIFDFIEKGINFPLGFSVEKLTSKWNLADGNGGRWLYDGVINRDEIVSKAFCALVFSFIFFLLFFFAHGRRRRLLVAQKIEKVIVSADRIKLP